MSERAYKREGRPGLALVTGGAKGIGRAIATRLLRDGYRVAATYSADEAAAHLAERELAPLGSVSFHRLDLREPDACEALVAELGPVAVLVNNAAVVKDQFLRFASDADWQDSLAVNLTGSFRAVRAVLPGMQAEGWGRVVQMSSYVGRAGAAGRTSYAASKAGLLGLTRALAREAAPFGVTVNAICPGLILTERTREYRPQVLENTVREIPLGRAGEPEEVASLVGFLASREAGYVTGQVLSVDGGLYATSGHA